MNKTRKAIRLVLISLLVGSMFAPARFQAYADQQELVRLVVEVSDRRGEAAVRRAARAAGARAVRRVGTRAPREYEAAGEQRRAADLRRWRVIEVPRAQAAELIDVLRSKPAVADVHEEQLYEVALTPNDPYFPQQWGLLNASSPLADINAPAAWEKTTGSSNTVIAILDGGVDLTHEDLANKVWTNSGEVAGNGRDDDGNGYADDVHGWDFAGNRPAAVPHNHGTHVAGIAAAEANNGRGVAGVDWGARIMPVRVLSQSGVGREEWIARGIEYAAANGADVINLSLVGGPSNVLAAAVENAYAAGAVVVAAAGNGRLNTDFAKPYPVCADVGGVDMVLGVAATDEAGEPASFSNYGACVNVSAPGKNIWSLINGNRYRRMSGTSMSAPFAAGAAGLYLALHPGASPAEVIAAVSAGDSFAGARAEQWNARYKGRLNAARVVVAPFEESGGETPAPPLPGSGIARLSVSKTGPAETAPGARVTYRLTVENTGTGAAAGVRVTDRFDRDLAYAAGESSAACVAAGREVTCRRAVLGPGETVTFDVVFTVAADVRCGERLRNRASVYMEERGRSRRQAMSERVTTMVVCVRVDERATAVTDEMEMQSRRVEEARLYECGEPAGDLRFVRNTRMVRTAQGCPVK